MAPSGVPSPSRSLVHAAEWILDSVALRSPSPSVSSSPSDWPSLFESYASGAECVLYSFQLSTPSPSLSPPASLASGFSPCLDSHLSGMPSPSVSGSVAKLTPPNPWPERSVCVPLPTRPPERSFGLDPGPEPVPWAELPPPPPDTETPTPTVAPPPVGSTRATGPVVAWSLASFCRCCCRCCCATVGWSDGDCMRTVSSRPGCSPSGHSLHPRSGAASAPTPSTPATSPAATVPANLRSRRATGRFALRAWRLVSVTDMSHFPFRGSYRHVVRGALGLSPRKLSVFAPEWTNVRPLDKRPGKRTKCETVTHRNPAVRIGPTARVPAPWTADAIRIGIPAPGTPRGIVHTRLTRREPEVVRIPRRNPARRASEVRRVRAGRVVGGRVDRRGPDRTSGGVRRVRAGRVVRRGVA